MSDYLQNIINASGGYAAPVENLELPEEYSEEFLEFDEEDLATIAELQELDDQEPFDEYDALLADADGYGGECPPATQDIPLNLKNRQNAIDNVGYGPLNPEEPSLEFWQEKADKWSVTIPEAKKSICGNCVFFDRREETLDCIESGLSSGGSGDESAWDSIDQAELGYCTALDFKCAASRTCSAWAVGGPITATAGSKAAPKKDQIKGSSKNKAGSAASGKGVSFTKSIETSLSKKAKDHNEKAPDGRQTSVRTLKAVYRRGAGAFSSSHRPDQNRNSWAMGRVNAFLKLLKSGKPKNAKYTTDNDLLPSSHPRSTKGSASMSDTLVAAADPCWDGYKQVGTKSKNGKRVPNCVPSTATINFLVDQFNSEFGESRHIQKENAYSVAREAVDKYSDLSDDELYSAVLWELHAFADYSTSGSVDSKQEFSVHESYLPEGHPATESSLTASAAWVSGASDLEESSREVVVAAFSESVDEVKFLHASTRLTALVSSGALSNETLSYIKTLSDTRSKVI